MKNRVVSLILVCAIGVVFLEISLRTFPVIYSFVAKYTLKSPSLSPSTFVVLGESTSAIEPLKPNRSWPYVLKKKLEGEGLSHQIDVLATPGATSSQQLLLFADYLKDNKPKILITLLGQNDLGVISFNKEFEVREKKFLEYFAVFRLFRSIKQWLSGDFFRQGQLNFFKPQHQKYPISEETNLKIKKILKMDPIIDKTLIEKIRNDFDSLPLVEKPFAFIQVSMGLSVKKIRTPEEIREIHSLVMEAYNLAKRDERVAEVALIFRNNGVLRCDDILHDLIANKAGAISLPLLELASNCADGREIKSYMKKHYPMIDHDLKGRLETIGKNYLAIDEIVKRENLCWLVMQYPLRPIEDIKSFLRDVSDQNIYYIENKKNFEMALKVYSKGQIFYDLFAGDFGHTTEIGTQLIADSVYEKIKELRAQGACGL